MPRTPSVSVYSLHRPTDQARVRIDGRDHYLGRHGSPKSRQEYARLMAERFRPGGRIRTPPSVNSTFNGTFAQIPLNELFTRYLDFATPYSPAQRMAPSAQSAFSGCTLFV